MTVVLTVLGCWLVGSFILALAVGAWIQTRSDRP